MANTHIDSKMKVLRKQYNIVYDMLSKSGFGWNDMKKCVEVDSAEIVQIDNELKLQLIWLKTSIEIMPLMIWEMKKSLSTKYQMMEKSNEQVEKIVEVIVESARKKEHDQHNFMWKELARLEILVDVIIDALDIIVAKPWT
ncbi:Myb/SANT-like domain containing protein, partial [Parasponia andersonii]